MDWEWNRGRGCTGRSPGTVGRRISSQTVWNLGGMLRNRTGTSPGKEKESEDMSSAETIMFWPLNKKICLKVSKQMFWNTISNYFKVHLILPFFPPFFKFFALSIVSQEKLIHYLNIHYLIGFIGLFTSNAFYFLNFLFSEIIFFFFVISCPSTKS